MEGHSTLLKPAILFVPFQQSNCSNYCKKKKICLLQNTTPMAANKTAAKE